MPGPSLTKRVEILEEQVQALENLPARVAGIGLQLVQLHEAIEGGFSAVRQEFSAVRQEFSAVRQEMSAMANSLREEIRAGDEVLRSEIRQGDEESRRFMRVLHEEVISRIAAIEEGRRSRGRK